MNNQYPYLRPIKARRQLQLEASYADRSGELKVRKVNGGLITPLGQLPGISGRGETTDNYLIDDVDFAARIDARNDKTTHLPGVTLYGGYMRSQWGHFLMNTTARLWPLFQQNAQEVDRILFFADSPRALTLHGNYLEFFRLLGIEHKIVIADSPVSVDSLLVPDISFEHLRFFSREFLLTFDAVRAKCAPRPDSPRKIFMTRSQLPGAATHEINLEKIDSIFKSNGFNVIAPEKLPLSSLISLLNGAEVIASVSGSLAHNVLFANSLTEFIIVERTPVCNYFQAGISRMLGKPAVLIDAFRQPRPASSTGSLFLYAVTPQLRSFLKDGGFPAEVAADDVSHLSRELRTFLRTYRREYAYESGLQSWETDDAAAITEACAESAEVYSPWLSGSRPVFFSDLLHPRTLHRSLKRLLRSFKR